MSLSEQIAKTMNQSIETFVLCIIKKFNLQCEQQDLLNLWYNSAPESKQANELCLEKILKASKQELIAECKKRKLKVSGSKSNLIARLTGKEKSPTK